MRTPSKGLAVFFATVLLASFLPAIPQMALASEVSGDRITHLRIDGHIVPIGQFRLAHPDICEYWHYHAASGGYVTAVDGEIIYDPAPEGCGFVIEDGAVGIVAQSVNAIQTARLSRNTNTISVSFTNTGETAINTLVVQSFEGNLGWILAPGWERSRMDGSRVVLTSSTGLAPGQEMNALVRWDEMPRIDGLDEAGANVRLAGNAGGSGIPLGIFEPPRQLFGDDTMLDAGDTAFIADEVCKATLTLEKVTVKKWPSDSLEPRKDRIDVGVQSKRFGNYGSSYQVPKTSAQFEKVFIFPPPVGKNPEDLLRIQAVVPLGGIDQYESRLIDPNRPFIPGTFITNDYLEFVQHDGRDAEGWALISYQIPCPAEGKLNFTLKGYKGYIPGLQDGLFAEWQFHESVRNRPDRTVDSPEQFEIDFEFKLKVERVPAVAGQQGAEPF